MHTPCYICSICRLCVISQGLKWFLPRSEVNIEFKDYSKQYYGSWKSFSQVEKLFYWKKDTFFSSLALVLSTRPEKCRKREFIISLRTIYGMLIIIFAICSRNLRQCVPFIRNLYAIQTGPQQVAFGHVFEDPNAWLLGNSVTKRKTRRIIEGFKDRCETR